jgi:hypothetical protein
MNSLCASRVLYGLLRLRKEARCRVPRIQRLLHAPGSKKTEPPDFDLFGSLQTHLVLDEPEITGTPRAGVEVGPDAVPNLAHTPAGNPSSPAPNSPTTMQL